MKATLFIPIFVATILSGTYLNAQDENLYYSTKSEYEKDSTNREYNIEISTEIDYPFCKYFNLSGGIPVSKNSVIGATIGYYPSVNSILNGLVSVFKANDLQKPAMMYMLSYKYYNCGYKGRQHWAFSLGGHFPELKYFYELRINTGLKFKITDNLNFYLDIGTKFFLFKAKDPVFNTDITFTPYLGLELNYMF